MLYFAVENVIINPLKPTVAMWVQL